MMNEDGRHIITTFSLLVRSTCNENAVERNRTPGRKIIAF